MNRRVHLVAVALLAAVPSMPAQDGIAPALDRLVVPVHSAPDSRGVPYGICAAGPDYKVQFRGGMSFHPVLGEAYPRSLPVSWRTVSVTLGGSPVAGMRAAPSESHGSLEYRYDHGPVVELYDVLLGGIEQSFVFARHPGASGDLVIEGRVDTGLELPSRPPSHAPIVLRGPLGEPVVSYGEAFAFDAAGRCTAVSTESAGDRIRLVVPADWLAAAVFPVTVDPLLSTAVIATASGRPAHRVRIARDDQADDLMVTFGRSVSASDFDGWTVITEDDFSNPRVVFADVTPNWSTSHLDCAFAEATAKWVVVLQQNFPLGSFLKLHLHDSGDYTLLNSFQNLPSAPGTNRFPSVGAATGLTSQAFLVWQGDQVTGPGNTPTSEIWGLMIDTATGTAGALFRVPRASSVSLDVDREFPAVSPVSEGSAWLCAWQERDNQPGTDDWDVHVVRVRTDQTVAGPIVFGSGRSTHHSVQPRLAGWSGRYLLTYGQQPNAGPTARESSPSIHAVRVNWPGGGAPNAFAPRVVTSSQFDAFLPGGVAFDRDTLSHWVLTYDSVGGDVFAERVGFDAEPVESVVVYDTGDLGRHPAVVFDDDNYRFPILHSTTDANQSVVGRVMTHSGASSRITGIACGSATIALPRLPLAGDEFFGIGLQNAPGNSPAFLALSLAAGRTDLTTFGMPGCWLLVDPGAGYLGTLFRVTDSSGGVLYPLPLRSSLAALSPDVYAQCLYVARGANRAGLLATEGYRFDIR